MVRILLRMQSTKYRNGLLKPGILAENKKWGIAFLRRGLGLAAEFSCCDSLRVALIEA